MSFFEQLLEGLLSEGEKPNSLDFYNLYQDVLDMGGDEEEFERWWGPDYFNGAWIAEVLGVGEKEIYALSSEQTGGQDLIDMVKHHGELLETSDALYHAQLYVYNGISVVVDVLDNIGAVHVRKEDIPALLGE